MKLTAISIKSLTVSAIAASTLVGMGLTSAPAQAGVFSVTGPAGNSEDQCVAHPSSPFWQGSFMPQPCPGYNNGLVHFDGGQVLVEYYGKGVVNPASFTNGFQLNNTIIVPPIAGTTSDAINWASPPLPTNNGNGTPASFKDPSITGIGFTPAPAIITLTNGNIPFQFLNNIGGPGFGVVKNGDTFTANGAFHYFAYQRGNSVYLGLDDSGSSGTTSDAEDFLVKFTAVPESSNVLGLLAIGGLGLAAVAKRKKQK